MNTLLPRRILLGIMGLLALVSRVEARADFQTVSTKPRVLEIFNPWDGSAALERPLVQFQGDTSLHATTDRSDLRLE